MKNKYYILIFTLFVLNGCIPEKNNGADVLDLIESDLDSTVKDDNSEPKGEVLASDNEKQELENAAKIEKMIEDNPERKTCYEVLADYELFLKKNINQILKGEKTKDLDEWNTNAFFNECIKKNSNVRVKKDSIELIYFGED